MKTGNIIALIVLTIATTSCNRIAFNRELDALDISLDKREQIRKHHECEQDSLKQCLKNASTVQSLEILQQITIGYIFYNCDSTYKYAGRLYRLAEKADAPEYIGAAKIAESFYYHYKNLPDKAIKTFETIDKNEIKNPKLLIDYYDCGHTIYKGIDSLKMYSLHRECQVRLPDSQIGIRTKVSGLMDTGQYEAALSLLTQALENENWPHRIKAIFYLYISNCYSSLGDKWNKLKFLVHSAEEDCLSGYNQYASLMYIADELYSMREYDKVAKYLKICMDDFQTGAFDNRSETGKMSLDIMEYTILKVNRLYHFLLILVTLFAIITISAIWYAYRRTVKQKKRIKKINEKLVDLNRKLKRREQQLTVANLIRDKYVFRFMMLSKEYLNHIDNHVKKLNKVFKTEGVDAVAKELRRRDITEQFRKDFYDTFDKTFLGLFPDFVDKFNSLMPEDERIQVNDNGRLSSEIRIFASIKLGITSSREIADFLDYALTTVYTYRTRIKNKALCDKNDFERKICE